MSPRIPRARRRSIFSAFYVDDDHIGGVLELLDNAMQWKVFDHHQADGDKDFNQPTVPRCRASSASGTMRLATRSRRTPGKSSNLLAQMVPMLADMDDEDLRQLPWKIRRHLEQQAGHQSIAKDQTRAADIP